MLGAAMEREILEQPHALARNAEAYRLASREAIWQKQFDLVLLVARGSSDNAALIARYWIEVGAGIPVSLAAPSVLTRYGTRVRYPKRCLAIGISQSGAAPDVAEVLCELRQAGHTTLAITNTAGSRITKEAEHSILLDVGKERSVAATKTYSASLLALYQVASCLGELPSPELPTEDWCQRARKKAEEDFGTIVRSSPVFALARGYGFGTAHETALKLMECALIPAKAYSSADFEHGPKALARHGSAAISFDGPKEALAKQGCEILSAPQANVPEPLRPLWDIFYGQWLALLAARARGLDPDSPQHIQKVTETL